MRLRSAALVHYRASWPVVSLLLIALIAPTLCVLWFMTEAMRNERLAVRQKLLGVYQNELRTLEQRLDTFWKDKQVRLSAVDSHLPASQRFAELVRSRTAEGVIIYDSAGKVRYPATPQPQVSDEATGAATWQEAWQLEFERAEPACAAAEYARIAQESSDNNVAAKALQAQARCLVKAGKNQEAIEILIGPLADSKYRHATTSEGTPIVPHAQLMALQLMGDPSSDAYRRTLSQLIERLADYSDASFPSSQRIFLMQRLRAMGTGSGDFPTLEAELLAAEYLEASPPHTLLRARVLPDAWQLASPDKTIVALFRMDRIRTELQALVNAELTLPEVRVVLSPPGSQPSGAQALVTSSAGEALRDWKLCLSVRGSDPFGDAAAAQIAVYLWTGILVIVVIGVLVGLVLRYVSKQMRLTRLRNDLVATVSHELKTPLSSIRALAESLIEGRYRDDHERQEYLQLIAKENQRLSRLIDNFLSFSRMERGKQAFEFRQVKIGEIVDAAVDAERERLEAPGCRLDIDLAVDLPGVKADADALTTVLVNLLNNAYKYSGKEKHIVLRAYQDDGKLCVEVKDNGVGLSRRAAKRVFDRFYQVDQALSRHVGGCGLGLSIVKFLVEAHGGSIGVTSQPSQGTTFTVKIPV